MDFNNGTEDYFYLAPDAESVLMRATGRLYHTVADCVWGYSVIPTNEEWVIAADAARIATN